MAFGCCVINRSLLLQKNVQKVQFHILPLPCPSVPLMDTLLCWGMSAAFDEPVFPIAVSRHPQGTLCGSEQMCGDAYLSLQGHPG